MLRMCRLSLRRENYAKQNVMNQLDVLYRKKNTTHQIVVLRNGFDDESALVDFFQMHFFFLRFESRNKHNYEVI